ncbi:twitchin-like [Oppia nitens]|uniref:twitchin-like n=1 Tax=Oppia nitens TaxID=1686743 RepID=UPI0023DBB5D1|nr:twitchin-like [Oppia nitens]
MVKNDSGQTDAIVQVFVNDLLGKPTGPLDVTDINKSSATISWKPPKYDDGCKITHYIIERKETIHNQWVAATSFCKDTTFTCQGLNKGGEYLFRVMAVNENGQSEPLVGKNPIVAKPPYDKPSAPGVPNKTDISGDFVNLHWEKPQSDGGFRIQSYIVEKRETGSEAWQRVNVAYCPSTQINIINLIKDRQYEFKVFAVNDAGLCPSLQNTGYIKIKNLRITHPVFIIVQKKRMAVENKNTIFTCTVMGVPKPAITSFKGVEELYDSGKYSMIKDGDTYTLTIFEVFGKNADEEKIEIGDHFEVEVRERHAILTTQGVSKLDSGPYNTTSKHELGIDSKVIKMQISDCPDLPRFPIVELVGDDFVTLSWKAPLWDGGSTITNYINEKREPTIDSWVLCGTTRFLMYQITGLNPNRDYVFRVFAENMFGKSGPSEKTQKITTKPSEKDRRRKGCQTDDSGRRIRGKEEMNKESVAVKKSTKEEESITVKNTVEDKPKQSIIKKDVIEEKRKGSIVIEEPKKKLSLKKSREKTPQPTDTGAKQKTTKEVKENEMEIKKTTIIDDKRKDSITVEKPKKRLSIEKSREKTPTDNGVKQLQKDDIGEYSVASDKGIECSCNVEVKEVEKKPELRLTQTDYQVDANHLFSIEIPYKVQGTRTSNVLPKLMRNGEPVSTKDVDIVIKEDKIIITFKKPTRESSGPYDFSLGNSQGESKTPLKFNFVDVPSPPEGSLDVTDVFRDRCKLAWNPTKDTGGLPPLYYVVERQDLSMRGGWVEVGTTPDCNMDVTDLAHKKEYKFRVRAVNKKGASEPLTAPKTYLAEDPYDEPSKPKGVEIVDWDRDHVDLKWKAPEKDGGAPIEKYIVESKDKLSADWVTALEVSGNQLEGKVVPPAIKEGQQYQFRVRAINKAGPSEPSDPTKNLIVKARFVKPFIIGDDLKNLVVKKGAIIKYDIQYGGEPAPEVKWAINCVDIKQSSRISIENTPKNTLLLIKQAVRADSGKFTLTLTNGSGTISKCADVVVLDKPTPPEGPLVVEVVFTESAKLKWKQPKDLGRSELKGYQIEKMDVDSGRWVPVGEVGPNANSFKCEGLTRVKKYKFRVKAINKEGESEPLETDGPIVAKNPLEEPSKPGNPEVVDYDNTKVDLKWTAPEKDGGRPVECYIVEIKVKFCNDWKEVLRTPYAKPEVSVKGLKENSSVQFKVKGVNIAGPGEPSEATEPHVVKDRNQKPYIDRTNLKNTTIKADRSHIYDDDRGEPPTTVVKTFSNDSIKLSDNLNIKIENIDYHSELTVSKATREQSGKYKTTATNRNVSDSVEVELTVLAAPSRPEGPLEVTDVHKEGCKLKRKPYDDGGTPIGCYEVKKMDEETGRWVPCDKTKDCQMQVSNLVPERKYKLQAVKKKAT